MLFTCSGSANVKNQRVVVFGQEHLPKRSNSSFDEQRSELQSGRNSQGSASCPETFRTYASSLHGTVHTSEVAAIHEVAHELKSYNLGSGQL
uniref:Uncharacterized protein n=1 Tax=Loa loa TaxID=7209 RepID=A0A1I7VJH0_LOALO